MPQSVTVTTKELMHDQLMLSIGDVMRYTPGIQVHQGENNRDQVIIRGNSSSADFFLNGVRDDVQYYRDLYNLERVEALKGPNAMMFGRGGGGRGREPRHEGGRLPARARARRCRAAPTATSAIAGDLDQPLSDKVALRLNGMYEDSDSFRDYVVLERYGDQPHPDRRRRARARRVTLCATSTSTTRGWPTAASRRTRARPADVDISTYYGNPDDSHVRADVDLAHGHRRAQGRAASPLRNRTMFGAYDRFYQNYVPGAVSADKSLVALTAYNNATAARQPLQPDGPRSTPSPRDA